jgi:hypothetical protein
MAGWALAGLYLSRGPSIAVSLFGLSNHLIGGLVVTLLCGNGAVTTWDCAPPRWSTALVWSPSASPRSLANACVR